MMAACIVVPRRVFPAAMCQFLLSTQAQPSKYLMRTPQRLVSTWWQPSRSLADSKPAGTTTTVAGSSTAGVKPEPSESTRPVQRFIKLLDEAGQLVSTMQKAEAVKLAKSKELKLVQVTEEDRQEPCYQLMTGKQLHENRKKERLSKKDQVGKKDQKFMVVNGRISEHDLDIKLKKIKVLLEKNIDLKIKIKVPSYIEEDQSRTIQSRLLKRITEETTDIASVKEASSTVTELIILLRGKVS